MSEFSDKCRAYIEKSNTNVYQIAKKSGLDRTMLQKMVKGTKVPSPPFFEKFCEFLVLNKTEKAELERLFKIERIGRDVYARRCEIAKLLHDFEKLNITIKNNGLEKIVTGNSKLGNILPNEKSINLYSEMDLVDAIRFIIKDECENKKNPQIFMDVFELVPYGLNQILKQCERIDKDLVVTNFVKFGRSNPTHNVAVENIRAMRMILPFAFKFTHKYEVYYSYINGNRHDGNFNIWAHYIVSQSKVLLISENMDEGLLINDPEVAAGYIQRMESMKNDCERLFISDIHEENNFEQFATNSIDVSQYGLNIGLFEPNYVTFTFSQEGSPTRKISFKETELYESFLDFLLCRNEETA